MWSIDIFNIFNYCSLTSTYVCSACCKKKRHLEGDPDHGGKKCLARILLNIYTHVKETVPPVCKSVSDSCLQGSLELIIGQEVCRYYCMATAIKCIVNLGCYPNGPWNEQIWIEYYLHITFTCTCDRFYYVILDGTVITNQLICHDGWW